MAIPEPVKGYVSIVVEEATGKTQRDQFTWDTNAGAFEAFVKGKTLGLFSCQGSPS